MENVPEIVKSKALALGFSEVGFTSASMLDEEGSRLQEWISRGYQGTMHWMERRCEERIDPSTLLADARSVIVVAVNYMTPHRHSDESGSGKVSRYAWGDDYHTIVLEKLEALVHWLDTTFPGSRSRAYVDTGPVMEKALAARAGIGWQGKHSNVITREYGSWVFLGEIITTLDLPPDTPAVDHCGTCTLCIEACPTKAIVDAYVVDARRCISYLTIEHRGPVDESLGDQFEGWVFGCDICQDVCPWNLKFSRTSTEQRFEPRESMISPRLEEWSGMTEEEFRLKFDKSPIRRAKWQGLMRNVQIALRTTPRPAL